ncbi:TPA: hypothetical protein ACOEF8_004738, partial [Enterobacter roggenkampii]
DVGDIISEDFNAGIDTVRTSINYTVADNVENVEIIANVTGVKITGNALSNKVTASNLGDVINGMAGDDHFVLNNSNLYNTYLNGGTGNDKISFSSLQANSYIKLGDFSKITDIENVDFSGNLSQSLSISSSSILNITSGGGVINIVMDSSDNIFVTQGEFYSVNAFGSKYTFYDTDPALGGAHVIATANVTVV